MSDFRRSIPLVLEEQLEVHVGIKDWTPRPLLSKGHVDTPGWMWRMYVADDRRLGFEVTGSPPQLSRYPAPPDGQACSIRVLWSRSEGTVTFIDGVQVAGTWRPDEAYRETRRREEASTWWKPVNGWRGWVRLVFG